MLVIFPFEEQIYRSAGVNVEFVGHPLLDMVRATKSKQQFCLEYKLDPEQSDRRAPSRQSPQRGPLHSSDPVPGRGADRERKNPRRNSFCPWHPGLTGSSSKASFESRPITVVANETYNAVRYARAAIVASGTATLETALLGTPEVIVYRISRATWFLGKFLLKVRMFGIVNIILGEEVVPELFQDKMTPDNVSKAAIRLMDDVWLQSRIRGNYERLRRQLGSGNVPERVVAAVAQVVSTRLKSREASFERLRRKG